MPTDPQNESARSPTEPGLNARADRLFASTALVAAAMGGQIEIMRLLLTHGADVNAGTKSREGYSALIGAAENSHLAAIQLLLQHGAEVNARNRYGDTALLKAVALKQVRSGNGQIVRILLEHGADAAIRDASGKSALDHARQDRDREMVELLKRPGEK